MVIKPKTRGFICITAHPEGCAAKVREEIAYVRKQGAISGGPKTALILGASTGYGLSSRIASAFGCGAGTLGVFFERPGASERPASAGWYNTAAFEKEAEAAGLWARSVNGDAFSDAIKNEVINLLKGEGRTIDLVVYSLASPRKTDPDTGETHRSVIKPIGDSYTNKTLNTDKGVVEEITVPPATEEEIESTVNVMGGADWQRWMTALDEAGLLAEGCVSVAYDYVGPSVTWPIYRNGTIGQAKKDLKATADRVDAMLKVQRGMGFLSVNKAVVTQASSAIPVVPLYISLLFKIMKEKGLHEDCIQQIDRLFRSQIYNGSAVNFDEEGRARIDDLEMREEVQNAVAELWQQVSTENLDDISDFAGYRSDFLKLFGFGMDGIDYEKDVDPDVKIPSLRE